MGEYASVDAQIKALEVKKAQLRPFIIQQMIDEGMKKVDIGVGSFSLGVTKSYTYSEKVDEMADALKAQKALEESTGDAVCEESPRLTFTGVKL